MQRRLMFRLGALGVLLAITIGMSTLVAVAQEASPAAATPAAVAPPQALLPANADYGSGQTAKINGVDIYYEVYGEGKGDSVILLHGGLSNSDHWVSVIPGLAKDHEVVVMDSRGHGRSSFDERPISYELMATDVLGLMDHLGIDKASIVGWSDGGIIGLELAINHRERLNKVVAYGALFDQTGERLDVRQNAYFNAYIAAAAEEYQRHSPAPQRWDEFLANISHMWATEPNYTEDQLRLITTPILILDGALVSRSCTPPLALRRVETKPGATALTRMPYGARSQKHALAASVGCG
jgi:pimeloyl-ACP methyl ester carboxylesterase